MQNVPYFVIKYEDKRSIDIERTGEDSEAETKVSFKSFYEDDSRSFSTLAWWCLIMVIVLVAITWCSSCCIQTGGNLQDDCFFRFLLQIFRLLDIFSTLFFWYLVLMTGYWFVFFKLQERIFCFLPSFLGSPEPYLAYTWFFSAVGISKLISMLFKIRFVQCAYHFYIVDWER